MYSGDTNAAREAAQLIDDYSASPFPDNAAEQIRALIEYAERDTRYQGYENHETWHVTLVIDNDERTYNRAHEITREVIAAAPSDPNVSNGIWNVEQTTRYRLADLLKDWVEESLPDLSGESAGKYHAQAFMRSGFESVNWDEVADHFLSSVRESEMSES